MSAVGLIFTLVGTLAILSNLDDIRLDLQAQRTTGTVTELEEVGRQPKARVHFKFTHKGDTIEGASTSSDWPRAKALLESREATVEYCPSNPKIARIVNTHIKDGPIVYFFMVFPILGLTVLFTSQVIIWRRWQTLRTGLPHPAVIIAMGQTGLLAVNHRKPYIIRWQFSLNGATYSASCSTQRPQLAEQFSVGTEVVVVVHPKNPKRSLLYLA